jgi:hypothetical protein
MPIAASRSSLQLIILSLAVTFSTLIAPDVQAGVSGVPATTTMHFRNGAVAIAYLSTVLLQLQEKGAAQLRRERTQSLRLTICGCVAPRPSSFHGIGASSPAPRLSHRHFSMVGSAE